MNSMHPLPLNPDFAVKVDRARRARCQPIAAEPPDVSTPKFRLKRAGRQTAMAMVVTLAIIVIVTGVVVAFFSQTTSFRQVENSRAKRKEADVLAQSAGNYVINLFQQEIVNNSTPSVSGSSTIYTPNGPANTNIVPSKAAYTILVSDTNFYTLVKQSGTGATFTGVFDPKVSTHNTAMPAKDGRFISPNRWNMPKLATGSFSSDTSPNWVYVSGSNGATTTLTGVNGRFAYNVYNIGGLLNANIAGYPSAAKTQMANMKGTVAGADLTQLPGLTGASGTTAVDALIGFRNPQATGTNYADYVAGAAANGFLSNTVTGTSGAAYSSNYFTGRQDLLRYAAQNPAIQPALPYLTTFSLATNAPTWKPDAVASGNSATIGSPNPANVDVLSSSIRVATTGTFTHYDDNGNRADYPVNAGDPLIQRRFSLAKLSWITHVGPGVGINNANTAILASFGLVWNQHPTAIGYGPTSPRWEYTALSTDGQNRILRLDEVAAKNREPNFFELLKAGILWGSLGRDPGHYCRAGDKLNGVNARTGVEGMGFEGWSTFQDMQILQIGVNLIDQVTPGNYPNAIWSGIISTTGPAGPVTLSLIHI